MPPQAPEGPAAAERRRLAEAAARLASISRELRRRGSLLGQRQPGDVRPPRFRLLLGEMATLVRVRGGALLRSEARSQRLADALAAQAQAPAIAAPLLPARGCSATGAPGQARPVMLLPGFATHPRRMEPMARALAAAGHRVGHWGLGFNLGPTVENFDQLCRSIVARAEEEGEPLALIGWSLGGLFAREAAKRHPEVVALVVTLGSPFSGDLHANRGWRWYQGITGHEVTAPPVSAELAVKPPVRTVALWSPRDGVVAARSARGRPGERDEAVAVRCTHLGFPGHPQVIGEVLRQLSGRAARSGD